MNSSEIHDILIAGGGPAGLSAALLLGRCMRSVVLCDAGRVQSPSLAPGVGISDEVDCSFSGLFQINPSWLDRLDNVTRVNLGVRQIGRSGAGFGMHCADGRIIEARAVLIVSHHIPTIPDIHGAESFFGTSLHQYPYCDGWNHRGQKLGVLGTSEQEVALAIRLLVWSDSVTLFTDGEGISDSARIRLAEKGIHVEVQPVMALQGADRKLEWIRLADGYATTCQALYFTSREMDHSGLAASLGCNASRMATCETWLPDGGTGIQGLFFAGNPFKAAEMAVIAAADGIKAAEAANRWLAEADQSYLAVQRA